MSHLICERTSEDEAVERHLDALNRTLLDRLQRGGEAFLSNAVVGGRYVLRACIVNFHTTEADVAAVPEIAARLGRIVDAELRPHSRGAPARSVVLPDGACDDERVPRGTNTPR